jgi:hypothetical protein
MRIDRLKQAAIIELDKQIEEKQGEVDHLTQQTGVSLWMSDLDEFEEAWKAYAEDRRAESTAIASSESGKAAPRVIRRVKKTAGK